MDDRDEEPRRSASAEAAALRRAEREPDPGGRPAPEDGVARPARARRPSASAEAAALRWRDEHPDE